MWQKVSTDKFNVLLLCSEKIGFLDHRAIAKIQERKIYFLQIGQVVSK